MRDRTKEHPDPRRPPVPRSRAAPVRVPEARGRDRARGGERRRSRTFRERSERALADVGIYGCVSVADLAEAHFGGRPYTTRRAIREWTREGLARETAAGEDRPGAAPLRVVTLTRMGAAAARDLAPGQGLDPDQRFSAPARIKRARLAHDAAIYGACARERRRLADAGARIGRVRLGGELLGAVSSRSESVRLSDGPRAARTVRHRLARELGLPLDASGSILYPDAQIAYRDASGRSGRVNIEVVSGDYSTGKILAKAAAGFVLHSSGPAATSRLRELGLGGAPEL